MTVVKRIVFVVLWAAIMTVVVGCRGLELERKFEVQAGVDEKGRPEGKVALKLTGRDQDRQKK